MEAIKGFKYKRRTTKLSTAPFEYDEVVTPYGVKTRKKQVSRKARGANVAKVARENPLHDPNAQTRPSKRRAQASVEVNRASPNKRAKAKKTAGKQPSGLERDFPTAPLYPTQAASGIAIRKQANQSYDEDKIYALFDAVLCSELDLLSKSYHGAFQFVVNAIDEARQEFLDNLREDGCSATQEGLQQNTRNTQLVFQKAQLQMLLNSFRQEEKDWLMGRQGLESRLHAGTTKVTKAVEGAVSQHELQQVQQHLMHTLCGLSKEVDTLQQSVVASRDLCDSSLQRKDDLAKHFAAYTHRKNGNKNTPRKLIKSLLRVPISTCA